jgi:hypothetical protein
LKLPNDSHRKKANRQFLNLHCLFLDFDHLPPENTIHDSFWIVIYFDHLLSLVGPLHFMTVLNAGVRDRIGLLQLPLAGSSVMCVDHPGRLRPNQKPSSYWAHCYPVNGIAWTPVKRVHARKPAG